MSRDNENRKWNIADIGRALINSVVAIFKGQFILRLGVDKYFPQVVWTFILFALIILFASIEIPVMTMMQNLGGSAGGGMGGVGM